MDTKTAHYRYAIQQSDLDLLQEIQEVKVGESVMIQYDPKKVKIRMSDLKTENGQNLIFIERAYF